MDYSIWLVISDCSQRNKRSCTERGARSYEKSPRDTSHCRWRTERFEWSYTSTGL